MEQSPLYAILDPQSSMIKTADQYRAEAYEAVGDDSRSEHGQFFTPPPIAQMMASLFEPLPSEIRLLDAGAGVGALTAAFVDKLISCEKAPKKISVTAYESERKFYPFLKETLDICRVACEKVGISFSSTIKLEDFVDAASAMVRPRLLEGRLQRFNCAILNPPYKKIHSQSAYRRRLQEAGIETVNLYTAFLALTILILEPGGQLVAITPRSFCNGPYYKAFRKLFHSQMAFQHIHLFESRNSAFAADDVLQENIIFHAVKTCNKQDVIITSSPSLQEDVHVRRIVSHSQVINPNDPHLFIHITASELDQNVVDRFEQFPSTLFDLGLDVSTGRVVDFRSKPFLHQLPNGNTVPLIYPHHIQDGFVRWPDVNHRKPNAFIDSPKTRKWLLPAGFYVVERASATRFATSAAK